MYSPMTRSYLADNTKVFNQLGCYHYRFLTKTIIIVYLLAGISHVTGKYIVSDDIAENHEVLEFQHLTSVNGSKLHKHDYHIIKIKFRNESSFMMHLSKPDIFSSVDEELNHEMEQLHCVYSGSITNPGGKAVGMAALSSCNHEDAFEGLMSIHGQHFQVAPIPEHNGLNNNQRIKRSVSPTPSFKYKAMSKFDSSILGNVRRDTIKVPPKELAKAIKQMMKDQEALEDEESDDDNYDSEDNNEIDDGKLQALLDEGNDGPTGGFDSDDSNSTLQDLETEYAIKKQSAILRRKRLRKARKQPAKVVELALFTDPSFNQKWQAKYPTKPVDKIKEFLLQVVNNMNYIYHQPSLGDRISFRLVHIGILRATPEGLAPSTTSVDYLNSFCKFQGQKDTDGALWDHGTMFTALDLVDDAGSDTTVGLAFTGTMCLREFSCSVIEFTKGFETGFTLTHEMGHSLGMFHDGDEMNKNCDPSQFIMAAVGAPGQINWSKCSVDNLRNHLKSGSAQPGVSDPKTVPRCIVKRGRRKAQFNYRRNGKFPGRRYPAQSQCLQACDGCSPVVSNTPPYNSICRALYCQLPTGGDIIPAHPALEGTRCGGGKKMCRNGKCQ